MKSKEIKVNIVDEPSFSKVTKVYVTGGGSGGGGGGAGTVTSVNKVKPDTTGNVSLMIGITGIASPDSLPKQEVAGVTYISEGTLYSWNEADGAYKATATIRGPQGDRGIRGETGPTGPQGLVGAQGIPGTPGNSGSQGPRGGRGAGFEIEKVYPSIAAMEADFPNPLIAEGALVSISTEDINLVENAQVFVKGPTKYEFLVDLSGATGIKGDDGADGAEGPQGVPGPQGPAGSNGAQGIQGIPGVRGATGETGPQGPKGDRGDVGPRGAQGAKGDAGAQGATGKDGALPITTGQPTKHSGFRGSLNGKLTKQGIFTRLELDTWNNSGSTAAAGVEIIVGTIPAGFRPTGQPVKVFTGDNTGVRNARHAFIIYTDGNIGWNPVVAVADVAMYFSVVY